MFLLSCCNTKVNSQYATISQDTVMYDNTKVHSYDAIISQDTVITISQDTVIVIYNIENISSQGAEAIFHYIQGKVSLCEVNIYGEMGKGELIYEFYDNHIKVIEKDYNYEVPFMEVTNKDIQLVKNFSYTMDLNGIPLEKVDSNRIDIFQKIKDVIPFVLK